MSSEQPSKPIQWAFVVDEQAVNAVLWFLQLGNARAYWLNLLPKPLIPQAASTSTQIPPQNVLDQALSVKSYIDKKDPSVAVLTDMLPTLCEVGRTTHSFGASAAAWTGQIPSAIVFATAEKKPESDAFALALGTVDVATWTPRVQCWVPGLSDAACPPPPRGTRPASASERWELTASATDGAPKTNLWKDKDKNLSCSLGRPVTPANPLALALGFELASKGGLDADSVVITPLNSDDGHTPHTIEELAPVTAFRLHSPAGIAVVVDPEAWLWGEALPASSRVPVQPNASGVLVVSASSIKAWLQNWIMQTQKDAFTVTGVKAEVDGVSVHVDMSISINVIQWNNLSADLVSQWNNSVGNQNNPWTNATENVLYQRFAQSDQQHDTAGTAFWSRSIQALAQNGTEVTVTSKGLRFTFTSVLLLAIDGSWGAHGSRRTIETEVSIDQTGTLGFRIVSDNTAGIDQGGGSDHARLWGKLAFELQNINFQSGPTLTLPCTPIFACSAARFTSQGDLLCDISYDLSHLKL